MQVFTKINVDMLVKQAPAGLRGNVPGRKSCHYHNGVAGDPHHDLRLADMQWADTVSSASCVIALDKEEEKQPPPPSSGPKLLRMHSSRRGLKASLFPTHQTKALAHNRLYCLDLYPSCAHPTGRDGFPQPQRPLTPAWVLGPTLNAV